MILVPLVMLAYALFVGTRTGLDTQSADLFAMWLAGDFMAMGRLDQIYPSSAVMFDMTTPSEWWPYVQATDPDARIFPYIYPPLWAKLVSWLTQITTFAVFDTVFLFVHQALLIATTYLAAKMCGFRGLSALLVVAVTYEALILTMPIGIALGENQPQILVSFLIVYAFERAQSGAPRAAGILLALAAAIKVYPVLFIVIFAARRNWRAVVAFGIAGGALGLTSIALAGWPLHADYLSMLGVLSKSVIVTNFSFSADALYAGAILEDQLLPVYQPSTAEEQIGWAAIAKGPIWHAVSSIAQIAAIAGVAFLAARRPHDPLIVPFAVTLFALVSPLSWAYTYLPAYVFIAALPLRFGLIGWGFAALMVVYFHPIIAGITLYQDSWSLWSFGVGGVSLMVVMLALLLLALLKRPPAPILPT
ncbi:DUF2029 domain-containing protein [Octadecabacter sp. G9-8]|uniref:DUF2029 domain-containing protein n=1 Tax=Octadecabacter dasysiphoniae TaxID=2909341 RepID=A0ABS9CXK3_9RHOB|nr:glycosyltransferase family 87 protein [Octadecabacter dasysiphoniae]MCF2871975.1 DUF2029 domain-containing protein [Octadecabacter dasysiphoniae]